MYKLFTQLMEGMQLTGDVRSDMAAFLVHHGYSKTAAHSVRVAAEAKRLATLLVKTSGSPK